jgi:photosystem II stability/assembly factor-like uncharacterized protein
MTSGRTVGEGGGGRTVRAGPVITGPFDGLIRWRCIGPFRGGRVSAVAGDPRDRATFYFGACAGGVWKTTDAGTYWQNVSDGFLGTASIGALAVAPTDPNVIWAGTGEGIIRFDLSPGDGVYRSTDAGRTWVHAGLEDTRHIGKIRVHPEDPDIAWVAALGDAFSSNRERGVFKTTDGGRTWRQVLFKSEKAGAVDLTVDATNPRVLYAAMWEAYRSFWQVSSGGPDSGVWRSSDGGETWEEISDRPGLPRGIKGKIGVAASPAQSGRVWALVEHRTQGGLYRSDDGGETWEWISDDQQLVARAWYYVHLTPHPLDPDTVYVNNFRLWRSTDGGRTFTETPTPHSDNHDLWIDPHDANRMIQGNDGGACVSLNGGVSWSTIYNQPTAQFYRLATDTRQPYYVYGTQQDNYSVAVPSRAHRQGISWRECFDAGTGESGYVAVRPDDPNIVYVGAIGSSPGGGNALERYDHRTRQTRLVTTWPEFVAGVEYTAHRYRFCFTYPIVISPHDPGVLYVGGNMVLRSDDEGQTWRPISPDLTRADPATLGPTGGPVNHDNGNVDMYATLTALFESPHRPGQLWAASDDGLVHVSKDGGASWFDVTPSDLPQPAYLSCLDPSPNDPATVYLAATRYKLGDPEPYLYVTRDEGQTWERLDGGLPRHEFIRVIRADPERTGLLYVGTETGVWVSTDNGASWARFHANLPVVPIYDLLVRGDDLIAGTHGRSIWILDDLSVVRRRIGQAPPTAPVVVAPGPVRRGNDSVEWVNDFDGRNHPPGGGAFDQRRTADGEAVRTFLDIGENPPDGAVVRYYLPAVPEESLELAFTDEVGREIRRFTSRDLREPSKALGRPPDLKAPAEAGWNRFVWDLREAPSRRVEGTDVASQIAIGGPRVLPGQYGVTLKVSGHESSDIFRVVTRPELAADPEDLRRQYELALAIRDLADRAVRAVNELRRTRARLDLARTTAADAGHEHSLLDEIDATRMAVLEIEKELQVPDLRPPLGWGDSLNSGVRVLEQLAQLAMLVRAGDYGPTAAAVEVFERYRLRVDAAVRQFAAVREGRLRDLDWQLATEGIGMLVARQRSI